MDQLPRTIRLLGVSALLWPVWAFSHEAAELYPRQGLTQDLCSTVNTGSGSANFSQWQSLGLCRDFCIAKDTAFAVVQWQSCWCSDVEPGEDITTSVSSCSEGCPGYGEVESCGRRPSLFGYFRLPKQPTSTQGASTSAQESTTSTTTQNTVTVIPSPSTAPSSSETSPSSEQTTGVTQSTLSADGTVRTIFITPTVTPPDLAGSESSANGNTSSNDSGGLGTGAVVGIVIGVIAAVLAVAGAIIFWFFRRRKQEKVNNGYDEQYNMAVTVATGKHMDAIVVTDYRTGQDCIQYLRDSRAGSAQFIPLDKIRVKPLNERFRGLGNNIKMVVDVIECDAEIEPALHYAVQDTVVCDSIDIARDLCFRQNEKVKAVTLDGMVVSKNGSMTGGKTHNDMRRAGRWDEKEVEALQQEKDSLIDTIRAMERHGASYAKLDTLRTQQEGLKSRLSHAKADLEITEGKRPKIQARIENAKKRVAEVIEPELLKFTAAVDSRKSRITSLQDQINSVEDELFADFSEAIGVESIRVYEEKVLQRHHKAMEMRRKITEHEAKLHAQIEYLQSQDFTQPMLSAKERAAREAQHLKQLVEEEASLMKRVAALRKERKEQEDLRKTLTTKVNELEMELREIGGKKSKYEERRGKIQRRISSEETVLERLKDHKTEIFKRASLDHVKLPTVQHRPNDSEDVEMEDASGPGNLENSELLLGEDTANKELDFSLLPDARVVVDDKEFDDMNTDYEKRIGLLLTELERMQPNMRALDKFDVIQGRIGKEEEELDRIKQQALATASKFEEVKQERYDRFMEAFNHISGVIDSTYKQLTKSSKHPLGGTAYLNLENTEEPYLNGMKYSAMPPMKRFREMEHLSGGEKTVAALALLFAIHNYRPSPFFVLDEVDAALDNVNVNKVSTYIANCDFQCVVISLKDSFYEKADALVGICKDITLQQSKSMTLDLTQFD